MDASNKLWGVHAYTYILPVCNVCFLCEVTCLLKAKALKEKRWGPWGDHEALSKKKDIMLSKCIA